jgi:hypothetical protein
MGRLEVSVTDDDTCCQGDSMCALTPQLTEADFVAGTVTLPASDSCLKVTIQLVCAQ